MCPHPHARLGRVLQEHAFLESIFRSLFWLNNAEDASDEHKFVSHAAGEWKSSEQAALGPLGNIDCRSFPWTMPSSSPSIQ